VPAHPPALKRAGCDEWCIDTAMGGTSGLAQKGTPAANGATANANAPPRNCEHATRRCSRHRLGREGAVSRLRPTPAWARSGVPGDPTHSALWRPLPEAPSVRAAPAVLGSASGRRPVKQRVRATRSTRVASTRHCFRRCLTATPARADWHLGWALARPDANHHPPPTATRPPATHSTHWVLSARDVPSCPAGVLG